jgi:hypothetical protein
MVLGLIPNLGRKLEVDTNFPEALAEARLTA